MPKQPQQIQAIFFDVDGTLVDLFDSHAKSYREAFAKITGNQKPIRFFRNLFQTGSEHIVWKTGLESIDRKTDSKTVERLCSLRGKIFSRLVRKLGTKNRISHAAEELKALRREGFKLYSLTGNSKPVGKAVLVHTKLAPLLDASFFMGEFPKAKDKESLLRFVLAKTSVRPANALVIGDTPQDLIAANKTKALCLGVATGLFSSRALAAYGPVRKNLNGLARMLQNNRFPRP